jgi:hypothetical protein
MSGAARVLDLKAVRIGRGLSNWRADQPQTRRARSMVRTVRLFFI